MCEAQETNKKGGKCSTGSEQKKILFICYKRCIVLKILQQFGRLNGVTRLCLAVAPAPKVVLPFFLTTILPFKFSGLIWTQGWHSG